jgi:hypothetical protein
MAAFFSMSWGKGTGRACTLALATGQGSISLALFRMRYESAHIDHRISSPSPTACPQMIALCLGAAESKYLLPRHLSASPQPFTSSSEACLARHFTAASLLALNHNDVISEVRLRLCILWAAGGTSFQCKCNCLKFGIQTSLCLPAK